MRTLSLPLVLLTLAAPALADTFHVPAPVTGATVYPQGALLTRRATVDLPAGRHTVLIPAPGDFGAVPQIATTPGVDLVALSHRPGMPVAEGALMTPAQAAAQARVEVAEAAVEALQDRIADGTLLLEALEAQRVYLTALRPPQESLADADAIRAFAEFVRAEVAATLTALHDGERGLRGLQDDLADAERALTDARAGLARLRPPGKTADLLELVVVADAAMTAEFVLTETTDAAQWSIEYDLRLDTGDAATVTIDRKVTVQQWTGAYWSDIALTLSTSRPDARPDANLPSPDLASIFEPDRRPPPTPMAEPMVLMAEPEMMREGADAVGAVFKPAVVADGVAVTYTYPDPVTVGTEDAALFFLGAQSFDATPEIHASPRHDDTAYQVARFTNAGAEPILPGTARLYRDGHLVGETHLSMIPAGGEVLQGFGPIEGLRLTWALARNETGDTGILSRSSTRRQQIDLGIENLTGAAQEVMVFHALPYSEQEDLRVEVTARPAPDVTDYEDLRGVAVWRMTLAPGEARDLALEVDLDWPDGMELNWYP